MGRAKKTRKFAQVKRIRAHRGDNNSKSSGSKASTSKAAAGGDVRHVAQAPSALFFQANAALGPPYQVILDTNFFAHSVSAKLDVLGGLMDLLLAACRPTVTDCTVAELEKLGVKYRLALRLAKDERWHRLACAHAGSYADDCIVATVSAHRCYLVATDDARLRQRLRRIPGVPLIRVGRGKYTIEGLPDAT